MHADRFCREAIPYHAIPYYLRYPGYGLAYINHGQNYTQGMVWLRFTYVIPYPRYSLVGGGREGVGLPVTPSITVFSKNFLIILEPVARRNKALVGVGGRRILVSSVAVCAALCEAIPQLCGLCHL